MRFKKLPRFLKMVWSVATEAYGRESGWERNKPQRRYGLLDGRREVFPLEGWLLFVASIFDVLSGIG